MYAHRRNLLVARIQAWGRRVPIHTSFEVAKARLHPGEVLIAVIRREDELHPQKIIGEGDYTQVHRVAETSLDGLYAYPLRGMTHAPTQTDDDDPPKTAGFFVGEWDLTSICV
ncbi:MAG: hypothetical protein ABIG71_03345 [Candidatus Uhrbacteria bacterium]